jgi:hypothetical protein
MQSPKAKFKELVNEITVNAWSSLIGLATLNVWHWASASTQHLEFTALSVLAGFMLFTRAFRRDKTVCSDDVGSKIES